MRNPAGPVGPLRDEPPASPPLAVCLSGILSFRPGTYHQTLSPLSISRRAPNWSGLNLRRPAAAGYPKCAFKSPLARTPIVKILHNQCSTTWYYNQLFEDKTLLMISTG